MNDVAINKIQSIQRCVQRAREEHRQAGEDFHTDYTRQDAALLNVLRACETTIDLANHVIRSHQLGVPNSSSDTFRLLHAGGIIPAELAQRLTRMVGFRNLVVHQYGAIDLQIVESVIRTELDELIDLTDRIRVFIQSSS